MSQSLYHNPFMPTRYLHPRASGLIVFGGGGGGGGTVYTDAAGGTHATEADAIAANDAAAAAAVEAKKVADEAAAVKKAEEEAAAAVNVKLVADYKAALNAAVSGVDTSNSDEIGGLGLKIQALNSVAMPGAATDVEAVGKQLNAALQSKLGALQTQQKTAQEKRNSDLASGSRKQTEKAMTDPAGLVNKADVAKIDPNAAGSTIKEGTGSVATSSTIDPTKITETATAATPTNITAETIVAETSKDKIAGALDGENTYSEGAPSLEDFMSGNYTVKGEYQKPYASDMYSDRGPIRTGENPDTYMQDRMAVQKAKAQVDYDKAYKTGSKPGIKAAQGEVSAESVVTAATKDPATSKVMDLKTEDGVATVMDNPVKREIKEGEIITGVADAEKAAIFTEEIQAATATPSEKATVKGQLTDLMADFEGGETPAWASGALRNASAQMAQRGLGASSMAGQALVQAAMEAALPIAMQDAQTNVSFEMTNLSNRQQRAMLAAQQRAAFIGQEFDQAFQARVQNSARIADIANANFTADQSVALENSRNANSVNLANISNKQALIMAQAAAISQLDMKNLSNEQQAAVQNAQSFLAMDMANLSNSQQTEMFKSQSIIQSILTDTAATNASNQFNASSENQTKQFMANMKTQVDQFNATQTNTTNQFNAGADNAAKTFNAQVENQRNQFNAQNALVIAQANAQWRQNTQTINTAAQNEANMQAAQTANAFTQSTLDQIWQRERDIMDYAFKGSESSKDRSLDLVLADKKYAEYAKVREDGETTDMWAVLTKAIGL